jgi:hypothetical protein
MIQWFIFQDLNLKYAMSTILVPHETPGST